MGTPIRMLNNGAAVHAEFKHNDVHMVLCSWRDGEWVTWRADELGNAYLGNYHGDDFNAAVRDFVKRSVDIQMPAPPPANDDTIPAFLKRQAD